MDAIAAIRGRRSVRAFLDRPVERALLEELIADASHAPFTPLAAAGAWRFTAILGRGLLADIGDRALAFARANRPQLAGWEWTERPGFSVFHGAPAAVVISGRADFAIAIEECTRAGQLLDIAALARGLGCCWVGSPMLWLRTAEARRQLRLADGWTPHAAFALGWPDETAAAVSAPRPPPAIDWVEA